MSIETATSGSTVPLENEDSHLDYYAPASSISERPPGVEISTAFEEGFIVVDSSPLSATENGIKKRLSSPNLGGSRNNIRKRLSLDPSSFPFPRQKPTTSAKLQKRHSALSTIPGRKRGFLAGRWSTSTPPCLGGPQPYSSSEVRHQDVQLPSPVAKGSDRWRAPQPPLQYSHSCCDCINRTEVNSTLEGLRPAMSSEKVVSDHFRYLRLSKELGLRDLGHITSHAAYTPTGRRGHTIPESIDGDTGSDTEVSDDDLKLPQARSGTETCGSSDPEPVETPSKPVLQVTTISSESPMSPPSTSLTRRSSFLPRNGRQVEELHILTEIEENVITGGIPSVKAEKEPHKSIWICSKPSRAISSFPSSPLSMNRLSVAQDEINDSSFHRIDSVSSLECNDSPSLRRTNRPVVIRSMSTGSPTAHKDENGMIVCISGHSARVLHNRSILNSSPSPSSPIGRVAKHLNNEQAGLDSPRSALERTISLQTPPHTGSPRTPSSYTGGRPWRPFARLSAPHSSGSLQAAPKVKDIPRKPALGMQGGLDELSKERLVVTPSPELVK